MKKLKKTEEEAKLMKKLFGLGGGIFIQLGEEAKLSTYESETDTSEENTAKLETASAIQIEMMKKT